MSDGPVVIGAFKELRVVRTADATWIFEKADGCDALGVERWREIRIADADNTSKLLRNYVIELLRTRAKEWNGEHLRSVSEQVSEGVGSTRSGTDRHD